MEEIQAPDKTFTALGTTIRETRYNSGGELEVQARVTILKGLPYLLFCGVTLHELGHVWLTVHGITHLPGWAEEGLCEFLAYRFYSHLPSKPDTRYWIQCIDQNPHVVYGEGFRQIRIMAELHGFLNFLNYLKNHKHLPAI